MNTHEQTLLRKCEQTFERFIKIITNLNEMGVEIDVDGQLIDTLSLARMEILDCLHKKPEAAGQEQKELWDHALRDYTFQRLNGLSEYDAFKILSERYIINIKP